MVKGYIPERGDIVMTDFDPSAGHEQAHKRPALVLSPKPFNEQIKLALVAPITSRVRGHGFEVELNEGLNTNGVILCQQVKTIDYEFRGIKFIEKVSNLTVTEALKRVRALVN